MAIGAELNLPAATPAAVFALVGAAAADLCATAVSLNLSGHGIGQNVAALMPLVQAMPGVTNLCLMHCGIVDVSELQPLTGWQQVRELVLLHNPVCATAAAAGAPAAAAEAYAARLKAIFPRLALLDGQALPTRTGAIGVSRPPPQSLPPAPAGVPHSAPAPISVAASMTPLPSPALPVSPPRLPGVPAVTATGNPVPVAAPQLNAQQLAMLHRRHTAAVPTPAPAPIAVAATAAGPVRLAVSPAVVLAPPPLLVRLASAPAASAPAAPAPAPSKPRTRPS